MYGEENLRDDLINFVGYLTINIMLKLKLIRLRIDKRTYTERKASVSMCQRCYSIIISWYTVYQNTNIPHNFFNYFTLIEKGKHFGPSVTSTYFLSCLTFSKKCCNASYLALFFQMQISHSWDTNEHEWPQVFASKNSFRTHNKHIFAVILVLFVLIYFLYMIGISYFIS